MPIPTSHIDPDTLRAALIGYQVQRESIEGKIAGIRKQLGQQAPTQSRKLPWGPGFEKGGVGRWLVGYAPADHNEPRTIRQKLPLCKQPTALIIFWHSQSTYLLNRRRGMQDRPVEDPLWPAISSVSVALLTISGVEFAASQITLKTSRSASRGQGFARPAPCPAIVGAHV